MQLLAVVQQHGLELDLDVGVRPFEGRNDALLLLGLRGSPFLFAGEELGLADAVIPPERVVDPGLAAANAAEQAA